MGRHGVHQLRFRHLDHSAPELRPNDRVSEIGFGSGVLIQRVAAVEACVAGVDLSQEMGEQARARNAGAMPSRRVDLRRGSVESLPYDRNAFGAALAINSFQVWQNAIVGLREVHRVMNSNGRIALGFTPYFVTVKEGADGNSCDCGLH